MKFSAALFLAGLQLCAALAITSPPAANATEGEQEEEVHGALEKRADFDLSCREWGILYPRYPSQMWARCRRADGSEHYSTLTLNKCLTNNGGELRWMSMGNFQASCDIWSGKIESLTYYVNCKKWGGEWVQAAIPLHEVISNDNGELSCFGHKW